MVLKNFYFSSPITNWFPSGMIQSDLINKSGENDFQRLNVLSGRQFLRCIRMINLK